MPAPNEARRGLAGPLGTRAISRSRVARHWERSPMRVSGRDEGA
jgi:hypothetical protein